VGNSINRESCETVYRDYDKMCKNSGEEVVIRKVVIEI